MTLFLKFGSSSKVGNEDYNNNNNNNNYDNNDNDNDNDTRSRYKGCCKKGVLVDGKNLGPCIVLTVWRKSLLVNCGGFTVIDCMGNLVFRVDNYSDRPGEIVLMDGSGNSLLTMRRHKTLRLVDDWVIYKGEASDKNNKSHHKRQPICYMKKNITILHLQANSNILAHVFMGKSCHKRPPTFVIQGSYTQRSCEILETSPKKIVAEIKRKEAMNGCASFGLDVFKLVVAPGFDTGFAMSLVLLLDQMYS